MRSLKGISGTLRDRFLEYPAKRIVLSGPSGFLGARVLDSILEVHKLRKEAGVDPGEAILMSSSPGNLMARLSQKYGENALESIRASRVDYYEQHDVETWKNHLGSLGVHGDDSVFVNLAAVAGPIEGKKTAMHDVNYSAAVAAAEACKSLGVGHFIQSSTQATNAERAGQVPYSRGKAMADFHLAQIQHMPVTIACVGLLYCKTDVTVGQGPGSEKLNMIDLSVLPLTPIMGSGRAPLQPMEEDRPLQEVVRSSKRLQTLQKSPENGEPLTSAHEPRSPKNLRIYDAVGPETMSIGDLLQRFARYQGNKNFVPVYIDYRYMEKILNVKSLGNLNRQFVSLLRSEQDGLKEPVIGDPGVWGKLLGPEESVQLTRLDCAFPVPVKRHFPFAKLVLHVLKNPKVVVPGILLSVEIMLKAFGQGAITPMLLRRPSQSHEEQAKAFYQRFKDDARITEPAVSQLCAEFKTFDKGGKGELLEHEAMLLISSRSSWSGLWAASDNEQHKTFQEMRSQLEEFDYDRNGKVSFIEWACMIYGKKWNEKKQAKQQQYNAPA